MAYWAATEDDDFMLERGAELVLETARFSASRAEWNADTRRYEFSDGIGPDEYHEHVDNNAFTNHFAAWHLRTAADLTDWLRKTDLERAARLGAGLRRRRRFREVADAIKLPRDEETGLVEQFDGYFSLQDVDLAEYAGRTSSMQSILGIEGVARTQVIKQPDVLMLAYLLPDLLSPASSRELHLLHCPHRSRLRLLARACHSIDRHGRASRQGRRRVYPLHAGRPGDLGVHGNTADGIQGVGRRAVAGADLRLAGVRFKGDQVVTDAATAIALDASGVPPRASRPEGRHRLRQPPAAASES